MKMREVELMRSKESLVEEVLHLRLENKRLKDELENEQVRLAGCGVAALGYDAEDGKQLTSDDYGYSASYGDVVRLRKSYDRVRLLLESICVTEKREHCSVEELLTHKRLREQSIGRLIQWLRSQPSAPSLSENASIDDNIRNHFED